MSKLAGKVALITGGGSGIGLATARLFLQEGACVAITGRDEAKLHRAAEELTGGERLLYRAADVAEPGQVQELVQHISERLGRIDILVNNAGLNLKERAVRGPGLDRCDLPGLGSQRSRREDRRDRERQPPDCQP